MAFFDVLLGAVKGGATEGLRQEQERITMQRQSEQQELSMLRQHSLAQLRTANTNAAARQQEVTEARQRLHSISNVLPEDLDAGNMQDAEVLAFVNGPIFEGYYSAAQNAAEVDARSRLGTDSAEAAEEAARLRARREEGVFDEEGRAAAIRANMLEQYGPQDEEDLDPESEELESLHDGFNKQADHYSDSFEATFGSSIPTQHVGASRVVSDTLFRDIGADLVINERLMGPNTYRSFMEDFTKDNREEIVAAAKALGTPGGAESADYRARMDALRSAARQSVGIDEGNNPAAAVEAPRSDDLSASDIVAPEGGSIFNVAPEDVVDTTDMGTTRNRSNSRTRGSIARAQETEDSAVASLDPMARARQEIGGELENSPEAYEGALQTYISQLRSGRGTTQTRRRTVNLIYQFISSQDSDATVEDAEKILEELLSGE